MSSVPSRPVAAAWASCLSCVKTVGLAPRPGSAPRLGVAGQAQDALPDHVALHLARAPRDGQAARREEPLAPAARVALGGGAAGAEPHEPEFLEALLVLGAEQLAHARLGTGLDTRHR